MVKYQLDQTGDGVAVRFLFRGNSRVVSLSLHGDDEIEDFADELEEIAENLRELSVKYVIHLGRNKDTH